VDCGFADIHAKTAILSGIRAIQVMPKYQLAIFDLDGTLSDSFPWFLRIVNSIADKHRFKRIEVSDVEMLRGKSAREIIEHLQVPMWRIPALGGNAGLVSQFACGASLFGKAAKFKTVLKRTGIAAADAICIGDEVRDGDAARAAGIDFGAVSWGYAKTEALQQAAPVLMFERVSDISRLI
jgi:phosphoglycolate phosphatase